MSLKINKDIRTDALEMGDDSIVDDYKRIVNSIIRPNEWFGYLPLVISGLAIYGTYYY